MADDTARTPARAQTASVGEVIDTVKTYARQETVEPLKRAGKYVAFGAIGGLSTGLGVALLLLGLLRFMQSEWAWSQGERWTWLVYLIALIAAAALGAISMWYASRQIKKSILGKDPS